MVPDSPIDAGEAVMVQRAALQQADVVARVLKESFADLQPLYTEASYAATVLQPEDVRARMAEGPVWVATAAGEVIGTCSAKTLDDGLYLRGMAVSPRARGKGVGKMLLSTVEEFAIDAGVRRLMLSATPFLASAIGLYERYGFVRDGEHAWLGVTLIDMHKKLG
jgi:GNAT superfamily N-acetyltransferase